MTPLFGVTGWKNNGKTTLTANLVREFSQRGYRVSTLKHAHKSFDIDHEGTDSFAHREAGAGEVALVSDNRWAIMHEVASEGAKPSMQTILAKLAPCDLILVEGFKNEDFPKIECIRGAVAQAEPIWRTNRSIIATASDRPPDENGPAAFGLSDIAGIADFIEQHCGLGG